MSVIVITASTAPRAADTLFNAFMNDPLMLWVFNGKKNYQRCAKKMFYKWVIWCIYYGVAVATPNFEAVALRKKPGMHHFSFLSLLRSGLISSFFVMGKDSFLRLMKLGEIMEQEQKANMKNDKFWHCWMLGTRTEYRGAGYGKELIYYTYNLAAKSHLPCYLETSRESNVSYFEKKGFSLLSKLLIPNSMITLYCMKKDF